MAAEVARLINVQCFPGPSLSAPRQVEEELVLAQTIVRAVSAPWREVARAENDPVIVLEVAESQNRQAERFLSLATEHSFFPSLDAASRNGMVIPWLLL
jgi:hypothetical protein